MVKKPMMKSSGSSKMKKYDDGGPTGKKTRFEIRQDKKIAKAQTRAAVAEIEGEGTVAQKRNNRADRASKVLGTARAKTPKSVSTSTSTSNSTTDNRNSGNTSNTTYSGSSSGSNSGATGGQGGQGGAGGRSNSSSPVDQSKKSTTIINNPVRGNSPRPPRPSGKGPLIKGKRGMIVKPKAMYGKTMKPGMMKKGGTKK